MRTKRDKSYIGALVQMRYRRSAPVGHTETLSRMSEYGFRQGAATTWDSEGARSRTVMDRVRERQRLALNRVAAGHGRVHERETKDGPAARGSGRHQDHEPRRSR